MKPEKKAQKLVDKIKSRFNPGRMIVVTQDDGSIEGWTFLDAGVVSNTAVIWCKEHRSGYSAERVIFEKNPMVIVKMKYPNARWERPVPQTYKGCQIMSDLPGAENATMLGRGKNVKSAWMSAMLNTVDKRAIDERSVATAAR